MYHARRLLALALVVSVLIPSLLPQTTDAQDNEDGVALLMERMSSAAKVGQLFLVTFPGTEVTEEAAVTELIRDYHVSGVVLLPENGNIVNEGDTPVQVATLVGQLQEAAWEATQLVTETLEETSEAPFIPLFIAANPGGDGSPLTSIINETTPLPSEMALGATWNPSHAEGAGQIVGQELRALGINMLLGPPLDVLETPRPQSAGDPGVMTFGGEPFWVGQMGKAYIRGVHNGANGRVAVVAKHFPGLGASDRSLNEEVSTVQRTLEKLRQIDLAPFFAVAEPEDPLARPDGLLVSHIRFRGLEGGRFVTTRPISVDSQVLQRLLGLSELITWREGGGVTVSDGLGIRALRRFYDPSEESFNSRRIAQEAFFAGNDLLLLSQFALSDDWDEQIANAKSTVTFFVEKYDSDPAFHTAVDAAVARILRLKLSLYRDTFSLAATRPNPNRVAEQVGLGQEVVSAIGRDAITLLSPPSPDLVPSPPTVEDNIVVFTDARTGQPCAVCAPVPFIDPAMLGDTMLRLYGPRATGQIVPWRLSSFNFAELDEYLDTLPTAPTPTPTAEPEVTPTPSPLHPVGSVLQNADWIIFAMLDPKGDPPHSQAVRRFLAERADALRDAHFVVLAYGAPYYLDATEISKLSAYYVAYGWSEPFVEASVRALFAEFPPAGTPPVSVTGINYDLLVRTSPDPQQIITLHYSVKKPSEDPEPSPEPTAEGQPTPEPTLEGQPTPEPRLETGDELRLQTSVIVDRNGNPVPDGTPVNLIFTYPQEGLEHSVLNTTRGGVAETTIMLDRTGQLNISVQADPVPRTVRLQLTIQEGGETVISTPTPGPTVPAPTVTPTVRSEPAPVETPQGTPAAGSGEEGPTTAGGAGMLDLTLALAGVLMVGGGAYYLLRFKNRPVGQALGLALWCTIGGLALYVAYALHVPGAAWLRHKSGVWAAGWVALIGSVVGLVIARVLRRRRAAE